MKRFISVILLASVAACGVPTAPLSPEQKEAVERHCKADERLYRSYKQCVSELTWQVARKNAVLRDNLISSSSSSIARMNESK